MHSVPCAAGGITVPIDVAWSVWLWAAPVPPNATSWGCLGKTRGRMYGISCYDVRDVRKKKINEYGVGCLLCAGNGAAIPPKMGKI